MCCKLLKIFLVALTLSACTTQKNEFKPINLIPLDTKKDFTITSNDLNHIVTKKDLLHEINEADVVVLGEIHTHILGHVFQYDLLQYIVQKFPNSTLALEMLERDEQPIIEDYVEGIISDTKFASLTHSKNWAGENTWSAWYQPLIDIYKSAGNRIVAANAPRRYVTLSRKKGYEALSKFSDDRKHLVNYPDPIVKGTYQERFYKLASPEGEAPSLDDETSDLYSFYRAQLVWDSTMASTIASLNPNKQSKVVLLVGKFHVEYNGGLIELLKRYSPKVKTLVVTVHESKPEIEFDTVPISDFIVYENNL